MKNDIDVSFNYHDIDTTVERLRADPEEYVIYISGDREDDSLVLTVDQSEQLIIDLRDILERIYSKEAK